MKPLKRTSLRNLRRGKRSKLATLFNNGLTTTIRWIGDKTTDAADHMLDTVFHCGEDFPPTDDATVGNNSVADSYATSTRGSDGSSKVGRRHSEQQLRQAQQYMQRQQQLQHLQSRQQNQPSQHPTIRPSKSAIQPDDATKDDRQSLESSYQLPLSFRTKSMPQPLPPPPIRRRQLPVPNAVETTLRRNEQLDFRPIRRAASDMTSQLTTETPENRIYEAPSRPEASRPLPIRTVPPSYFLAPNPNDSPSRRRKLPNHYVRASSFDAFGDNQPTDRNDDVWHGVDNPNTITEPTESFRPVSAASIDPDPPADAAKPDSQPSRGTNGFFEGCRKIRRHLKHHKANRRQKKEKKKQQLQQQQQQQRKGRLEIQQQRLQQQRQLDIQQQQQQQQQLQRPQPRQTVPQQGSIYSTPFDTNSIMRSENSSMSTRSPTGSPNSAFSPVARHTTPHVVPPTPPRYHDDHVWPPEPHTWHDLESHNLERFDEEEIIFSPNASASLLDDCSTVVTSNHSYISGDPEDGHKPYRIRVVDTPQHMYSRTKEAACDPSIFDRFAAAAAFSLTGVDKRESRHRIGRKRR